jgi:hypothetical protein
MTGAMPALSLDYPYPGLRPFEEHEALLFHGRQSHTEELLGRLAANRFLAVIGSSGSGKSSLVRAGLLPALHRGYLVGATSRWRIAVMRPGNAPLANLAKALTEQGIAAPDNLGRSSLGLVNAVAEAGLRPGESVLIVADQFEELIRFDRLRERTDGGAEAALFVAMLLEAAQAYRVSVYVIITMRSDFLGDCTRFAGLAEALNRGQYLTPLLTREQRREAIEGPLGLVGGAITPRLVQRLLSDLGENLDELPVLQHALNRTWLAWKRAGSRGPVDLPHYQTAGGIHGALNLHADDIARALPAETQPWVERMFRCLTTFQGTRAIRRPARVCDLEAILNAEAPPARAHLHRVIAAYADPQNSLVVAPGVLKPDSTVDISHESLIRNWGRLRDWLRDEAGFVDWYASAARAADKYRLGQAETWRGDDLARARKYIQHGPWNAAWAAFSVPDAHAVFADVQTFIRTSARRQWLIRFASMAAAVLVVSMGVGWWIYSETIKRQHAESIAVEQQKTLAVVEQLNSQLKTNQATTAELERQRRAGNLTTAERAKIEDQLKASRAAEEELRKKTTAALASAGNEEALRQRVEKEAADKAAALRRIADLEAELKKVQSSYNNPVQQRAPLEDPAVKRLQDEVNALRQQLEQAQSTPAGDAIVLNMVEYSSQVLQAAPFNGRVAIFVPDVPTKPGESAEAFVLTGGASPPSFVFDERTSKSLETALRGKGAPYTTTRLNYRVTPEQQRLGTFPYNGNRYVVHAAGFRNPLGTREPIVIVISPGGPVPAATAK